MLSSLLTPFVLPPLAPLLLAALGGLLRRRHPRISGSLVTAALLLLGLLSTPLVGAMLLRTLEHAPALPMVQVEGTGAIVVLGGDIKRHAPEYGGDTIGEITLRRVRYAALLQQRTGLPLLAAGGRIDGADKPLAAAMKMVLTDEFDVPVRWTEGASRNTFENAAFSASLLRREGIDRILLVTDAWHMPRAKSAFSAMGMEVVPAPTGFTPMPEDILPALLPGASGLRQSAFAFHEWIGAAWYRFTYLRQLGAPATSVAEAPRDS